MRREKEKSVTPMYKVGSLLLFVSIATLGRKEKEKENTIDYRA